MGRRLRSQGSILSVVGDNYYQSCFYYKQILLFLASFTACEPSFADIGKLMSSFVWMKNCTKNKFFMYDIFVIITCHSKKNVFFQNRHLQQNNQGDLSICKLVKY